MAKKSCLEGLFDLRHKVVVITGASGQLGRTIIDAFQAVGATVVGLDLKPGQDMPKSLVFVELDIRNMSSVAKAFEGIIKRHGRIDVLINNAGVSTFEPFEQRPEDNFDWVMDVNLKGTFFCCQAFVNLFDRFKLKQGSIINIASVFGLVSPDFRNYTDCDRKNSEIYGATKAGVIQMTKYFAVHLAGRNIRVNSVSPGGIFNPANPQGKNFVKNYSFRVPMQRMAEAEEMVGAIFYLASGAASYTTGQNIAIDGGLTCW